MEINNKLLITLLTLMLLIGLVPGVSALQSTVLDTNPSPAIAGEYVDITLRLTNSNNADDIIKELYFGIENRNEILVTGENPKQIGSLNKGQSISRTFRVFIDEKVPQGDLQITTYARIGSETISFDNTLFVQDSESEPDLQIGSIQTTPNELLPDTDDNKIILTLLNLGDKDADLVIAEITVDNLLVKPSYSYSMKDSVAQIMEGGQEELEFTIDLEETASGQIPATLNLLYRVKSNFGNSYETIQKQIPFTIDLIDAPYLEITNVEQLSSFEAGSTENEVVLTITNNGNAKAQEVRVRLIPDISYPFSFEQLTEYVASEIKPGESTNIKFTSEVFGNGEIKDYSITTRIESLIGETRYSQNDVFSINVTAAEKMSVGQIALWIVVLIIIVSIAFGVLSRRK